ncbi:hypothetical protein BOTBODRAFT_285979 [Botryobasidium botryosum FD-172 SS1]|uniref:C3H1-type domain-containing protein n=1 Tax=Botryobasidium botryosum (strain FD-172 SS1) TaxID=930990 RepID=A0A067MLV7_BOTB1|nr:hypothetical protein BOTBODRAFT_285979 [Botryobasidium botryosum FD-172 SS1]
MANPSWRRKTRPCPFYASGKCYFADACNFLHQANDSPTISDYSRKSKRRFPFIGLTSPTNTSYSTTSSSSSSLVSPSPSPTRATSRLEPEQDTPGTPLHSLHFKDDSDDPNAPSFSPLQSHSPALTSPSSPYLSSEHGKISIDTDDGQDVVLPWGAVIPVPPQPLGQLHDSSLILSRTARAASPSPLQVEATEEDVQISQSPEELSPVELAYMSTKESSSAVESPLEPSGPRPLRLSLLQNAAKAIPALIPGASSNPRSPTRPPALPQPFRRPRQARLNQFSRQGTEIPLGRPIASDASVSCESESSPQTATPVPLIAEAGGLSPSRAVPLLDSLLSTLPHEEISLSPVAVASPSPGKVSYRKHTITAPVTPHEAPLPASVPGSPSSEGTISSFAAPFRLQDSDATLDFVAPDHTPTQSPVPSHGILDSEPLSPSLVISLPLSAPATPWFEGDHMPFGVRTPRPYDEVPSTSPTPAIDSSASFVAKVTSPLLVPLPASLPPTPLLQERYTLTTLSSPRDQEDSADPEITGEEVPIVAEDPPPILGPPRLRGKPVVEQPVVNNDASEADVTNEASPFQPASVIPSSPHTEPVSSSHDISPPPAPAASPPKTPVRQVPADPANVFRSRFPQGIFGPMIPLPGIADAEDTFTPASTSKNPVNFQDLLEEFQQQLSAQRATASDSTTGVGPSSTVDGTAIKRESRPIARPESIPLPDSPLISDIPRRVSRSIRLSRILATPDPPMSSLRADTVDDLSGSFNESEGPARQEMSEEPLNRDKPSIQPDSGDNLGSADSFEPPSDSNGTAAGTVKTPLNERFPGFVPLQLDLSPKSSEDSASHMRSRGARSPVVISSSPIPSTPAPAIDAVDQELTPGQGDILKELSANDESPAQGSGDNTDSAGLAASPFDPDTSAASPHEVPADDRLWGTTMSPFLPGSPSTQPLSWAAKGKARADPIISTSMLSPGPLDDLDPTLPPPQDSNHHDVNPMHLTSESASPHDRGEPAGLSYQPMLPESPVAEGMAAQGPPTSPTLPQHHRRTSEHESAADEHFLDTAFSPFLSPSTEPLSWVKGKSRVPPMAGTPTSTSSDLHGQNESPKQGHQHAPPRPPSAEVVENQLPATIPTTPEYRSTELGDQPFADVPAPPLESELKPRRESQTLPLSESTARPESGNGLEPTEANPESLNSGDLSESAPAEVKGYQLPLSFPLPDCQDHPASLDPDPPPMLPMSPHSEEAEPQPNPSIRPELEKGLTVIESQPIELQHPSTAQDESMQLPSNAPANSESEPKADGAPLSGSQDQSRRTSGHVKDEGSAGSLPSTSSSQRRERSPEPVSHSLSSTAVALRPPMGFTPRPFLSHVTKPSTSSPPRERLARASKHFVPSNRNSSISARGPTTPSRLQKSLMSPQDDISPSIHSRSPRSMSESLFSRSIPKVDGVKWFKLNGCATVADLKAVGWARYYNT